MALGYQKSYKKTLWRNSPDQSSALSERNLMNLENGVEEVDNRIVQLDANKADMTTVNTMVKSVTMDTRTGIMTVALLDGTKNTYDLDIEKVVTNFDIDDDNNLVLALADGTQKTIDLTRFVYDVSSTATVSMTITDRVMRADIIDGSVTVDKLDAAIQTEFRQYMLDAQAARDSALQYQGFAERYAIGNKTEFPGSETDNAKYYYEQSKANAEATAADAETTKQAVETTTEQTKIATAKATSATASANSAAGSAKAAEDKAKDAAVSEAVVVQMAKDVAASETVSKQKAGEAEASANMAQRYAVGGVVPEDTEDNAKYYYEQSKSLKDEIDAAADLVIPQFFINLEDGGFYSDKAAKGMRFWVDDGGFYSEKEVTA